MGKYDKVYDMKFTKIYPLLVAKVEKKNRTKAEADEVIRWLTGYSQEAIDEAAASEITYGDFFRQAPQMNENRKLITGSVCGVKVQEVDEPLMQDMRFLDKLIDELAKGKAMEKVLRKA